MAVRRTRWMAQVGVGLTAGALSVGAALALPADAPLGPRTASGVERLQSFADCDELTAWYVKQALPEVTPWGFGRPMPVMYDAAVRVEGAAPAEASGGEAAVGSSETGTNVQEAGVDEPDVAKLMDDYVVSIDGHHLVVTDISGATPVEVSSLSLPGGGATSYELLVVDRRVLVLGTMPSYSGWFEGDVFMADGRVSSPMFDIAPPPVARSSLTTVDLSDAAEPVIVNRDVVDGYIATARENDGTIRVVTTMEPAPDLPFVTPEGPLTRAEALAKNRALVAASGAADWLPQRWSGETGAAEPLVDCADVAHPSEQSGRGTVSVITLDPENPAGIATTAISADASLVYASATRLYVSTTASGWAWGTPDDDNDDDTTEIHAFSTEGDSTAYVASGQVDGHVRDQWSFSEYNGRLRVASTLGQLWNPTETLVTVLAENGDQLTPVGRVGGMGVREEVKAVRWFGTHAVVVTFRQIDPLYLLDLSDPVHPLVAAELKVPGFSQYLHPVGDSVLLGVGQVGADAGDGIAASTFDLTDLQRLDQAVFASATYTATGTDARSFAYLPEQHIAVFPTNSWRRGEPAQLQVVAIGAGGDLTALEAIDLRGGGWAQVRSLPLDDARVAVVQGGTVTDVVDLTTPIR